MEIRCVTVDIVCENWSVRWERMIRCELQRLVVRIFQVLTVSRITKGKHAQFHPVPSSFDTCDHFSSFHAFHKFSRRNKFESIQTFVHSLRLYLHPGIYRGKTFLLALLIRSPERQMLNPYSLEWKIFTEAFSSAENIRLFVEKVARNWSSRLLKFTRDEFRCSFARRRFLKRGRSRRLD